VLRVLLSALEGVQREKRSAKKNGPVITRPVGREATIIARKTALWQPSDHTKQS
jgi:hypothetical protein